ncbi:MAG TPA: response regulator transcription factor [Sporichthyaceae bacterium]|jgi:DNA-binding NarL/FixJ family response regulator|nr:response regulator transcription factor [Sporichthyaceae bacterium]
MTDPIRLVICDDHRVVREGLRRVLSEDPDLLVLADVGTSADVVGACAQHRPDVVVLDVTLPDGSGIGAIPRIAAVSPGTRVLVLTMHDDLAYLREAFAAGAAGYVLKAAADVELFDAVHQVFAGHRYVHPTLGAALIDAQTDPGPNGVGKPSVSMTHGLSEREAEILRYLALGYTNTEMAQMLTLSVRTVETYRLRLQQKVGLRSRAELARLARESGLLP